MYFQMENKRGEELTMGCFINATGVQTLVEYWKLPTEHCSY